MTSDSHLDRRMLLRVLAGGVVLTACGWPAEAGEKRIERLIAEARVYGKISQRIDFISRALRGIRYRGETLIGGPKRPEKFVVRDDGFDCVTYCETVLAAAIATKLDEFEPRLRQIRYQDGVVDWYRRNHYFYEWCRHNVDNKTCRWVDIDGAITIEKTVDSQKGLSRRRFSMPVIPQAALLANKTKLETGDIVGFVSRRSNLDYFHAGFVAIAEGELQLRHASESRRRVLDERMDRFLALYGVRYVTLLRPLEPETGPVAAKKA